MHSIGWTLLSVGVFIGICAVAGWLRVQVERARDRSARVEWDQALRHIDHSPVTPWDGYAFDWPQSWHEIPEWQWPEGEATQHFFGTDIVHYDPEEDTRQFIARMEADTTAFLERIKADT